MDVRVDRGNAGLAPGALAVKALVLISLVVAMMLAAASSAQAGLPAICEQYPDLPQCQGPGGGGDDPNPPGGGDGGDEGPQAGGGGPSADGGGGAGDGDLPFTGYPVTGLVLLLIILLLAGLSIRAYLATRDRLSGDRPAGH